MRHAVLTALRVLIAGLAASLLVSDLSASRDFNGTTQRMSVAVAGQAPSAYPVSLSCWFNVDTVTAEHAIIVIADQNTAADYIVISADGTDAVATDRLTMLVSTTALGGVSTITTTSFSANTWHHAAAVLTSATNRAVWLDFAGKATSTTSRDPMGTVDYVGAAALVTSGGTTLWLDGEVAECAVWTVALTDDQIGALAEGWFPPKVNRTGLWAYWPTWGYHDDEIELARGVSARYMNLVGAPGKGASHPSMIGPGGGPF